MNIDLGISDTWPKEAMAIATAVARDIQFSEKGAVGKIPASDLKWRDPDSDADLEQKLRMALAGHRVLTYHATRLLPHEVDGIRHGGIGPLSADLIERKLRLARENYPEALTEQDIELLRTSGPLTWGGVGQRVRLGQLWVVAPIEAFADVGGFEQLLGNWGGEVIYRVLGPDGVETARAQSAINRINLVSVPSIVELAIDPAKLRWSREIWRVMVGVLLGARDPANEWYIESRVPASDVVEILQPGNARWPTAAQSA